MNSLPEILEHAGLLAKTLEPERINNITVRSDCVQGVFANVTIQLGSDDTRTLGSLLALAARLGLTGVTTERPYWLMPERHVVRGDYFGTTVEVCG